MRGSGRGVKCARDNEEFLLFSSDTSVEIDVCFGKIYVALNYVR